MADSTSSSEFWVDADELRYDREGYDLWDSARSWTFAHEVQEAVEAASERIDAAIASQARSLRKSAVRVKKAVGKGEVIIHLDPITVHVRPSTFVFEALNSQVAAFYSQLEGAKRFRPGAIGLKLYKSTSPGSQNLAEDAELHWEAFNIGISLNPVDDSALIFHHGDAGLYESTLGTHKWELYSFVAQVGLEELAFSFDDLVVATKGEVVRPDTVMGLLAGLQASYATKEAEQPRVRVRGPGGLSGKVIPVLTGQEPSTSSPIPAKSLVSQPPLLGGETKPVWVDASRPSYDERGLSVRAGHATFAEEVAAVARSTLARLNRQAGGRSASSRQGDQPLAFDARLLFVRPASYVFEALDSQVFSFNGEIRAAVAISPSTIGLRLAHVRNHEPIVRPQAHSLPTSSVDDEDWTAFVFKLELNPAQVSVDTLLFEQDKGGEDERAERSPYRVRVGDEPGELSAFIHHISSGGLLEISASDIIDNLIQAPSGPTEALNVGIEVEEVMSFLVAVQDVVRAEPGGRKQKGRGRSKDFRLSMHAYDLYRRSGSGKSW